MTDGRPAPRHLPMLDVLKLLAAYGVILIHLYPRDHAAEAIASMAVNFCVPFFLASSLYLLGIGLRRGGTAAWLTARLQRLLAPYAAWSIIYLILRSAKHTGPLSLDVPGLALLGKAAVQLYFLPMLAAAFLLAYALWPALRGWANDPRALLAITVTLVAAAMGLSLHIFHKPVVPDSVPSNGWAAGFVQLAWWAVASLPYLIFGLLLSEPTVEARLRRRWRSVCAAALALFLLVEWSVGTGWNYPGWLGADIRHLLIAGSALALGVFAPMPPPSSGWLKWLIGVGFGVYFIHHALIESAETLLPKLGFPALTEYRLIPFLLAGVAYFFLSAALTALLARWSWSAWWLLGEISAGRRR